MSSDIDWYCSSCESNLNEQSGFDENDAFWTCTECGHFINLLDDAVVYASKEEAENARFLGVKWYCDSCNALLSNQHGFDDNSTAWICTECGYTNNISEDDIYESEEDYQIHKSASILNWNHDTRDCEDGVDGDDADDDGSGDDDTDDDDADDNNDEGRTGSYQRYHRSVRNWNTVPEVKTPFKRRCLGILIDMAMIANGVFLILLAFDRSNNTSFGLTVFELLAGTISLWCGYLSRKAANKNDGVSFGRKLKGVFSDIAMKIAGVFLVFVDLDIISGISVLLRFGIGVALVIGGHFVRKEIG